MPATVTQLGYAEGALTYRVMSSQRAAGVEAELGGNPTPNWRLAISVAKFDAAESDIGACGDQLGAGPGGDAPVGGRHGG